MIHPSPPPRKPTGVGAQLTWQAALQYRATPQREHSCKGLVRLFCGNSSTPRKQPWQCVFHSSLRTTGSNSDEARGHGNGKASLAETYMRRMAANGASDIMTLACANSRVVCSHTRHPCHIASWRAAAVTSAQTTGRRSHLDATPGAGHLNNTETIHLKARMQHDTAGYGPGLPREVGGEAASACTYSQRGPNRGTASLLAAGGCCASTGTSTGTGACAGIT